MKGTDFYSFGKGDEKEGEIRINNSAYINRKISMNFQL
jgi:hypothetical protein